MSKRSTLQLNKPRGPRIIYRNSGGRSVTQVIADEVLRWLESEDYARLCTPKQMEEEIGMWEWGKWALKGEVHDGVERQISYQGRPESTAWEAIPDMADDDAMRIEDAMKDLDGEAKEILRAIYEYWTPAHIIAQRMCISLRYLFDVKESCLGIIHKKLFDLSKNSDTKA